MSTLGPTARCFLPEFSQTLDGLAEESPDSERYDRGSRFTDSTGGDGKNFRLSRDRADAVVQYLAVTHKIPLRRFVTPMGYGKTESVADNTTASGRAQNRRVEVRMLMNRGMSSRPAATSSAKP